MLISKTWRILPLPTASLGPTCGPAYTLGIDDSSSAPVRMPAFHLLAIEILPMIFRF
jgi:hypothetical protein